jgi:glycosyltransferase involved in cell wall biosynthesis
VIHDWLVTWRGGENVLAEVLGLLPGADLYALVDFLGPDARARLGGRHARTSFLQRMPLAREHFRWLLPLFPRAIRSFDLRGYDLVVSVSHAVAKNVRTSPAQRHLCYCLTPMRYAWDIRDTYLAAVGAARGPKRWIADRMLDRLQQWDRDASAGVDRFVAISGYIARRIERAYGRSADVIYPPVDVDYFTPGTTTQADDYYLAASRWVPYKRIDAIVAAFRTLPDRRLVVAGDGPDAARIRGAAGENVTFVGEVERSRLRDLMRGARAFVFAAEEDFGIMPLEAQACGTPVIAYGEGALRETLQPVEGKPTGVLFDRQDAQSIAGAIRAFEREATITPQACRENALRFAAPRFRAQFAERLRAVLARPAAEA